MSSQFEGWLAVRLVQLGTDESVFVPYILSILEVGFSSSHLFIFYYPNILLSILKLKKFCFLELYSPTLPLLLQGEDESQEEKEEGLIGLLSDVMDNEEAIQETLKQILEQWRLAGEQDEQIKKTTESVAKLDLVEKMSQITQEKLATYVPKKQEEQTEEQKKIKEAILRVGLLLKL